MLVALTTFKADIIKLGNINKSNTQGSIDLTEYNSFCECSDIDGEVVRLVKASGRICRYQC